MELDESHTFKKVRAEDILQEIAKDENVTVRFLKEGLESGTVVIPQNKRRKNLPVGIGKGLRTKVNANIGTSQDQADLQLELEKLSVAIDAGADTVMDLSTGGNLDEIRQAILEKSTVPIGTVPIYQAAIEAVKKKKMMVKMTEDSIFEVIERQAKDGVDFITVHCGVTLETVERLRNQGRITDVVSRGGAFLIEWMLYHKKENPLFEEYDTLLKIAKEYNLTLSLGDGLRPGCLADATDRAQIQELLILGELVDRAREAGVQAMVEGPGHIPLDQVMLNVKLEKELCKEAPFYVLGPLVTDVACGYDHIAAAIGGALAAWAGADFLCYVTPSEHLRLPTVEDVREGVIVLRIAAHAADIAKGIKGASDWDLAMSRARKALKWDQQIKLAIDSDKARELKESGRTKFEETCTMCGEYCAMKKMGEILKKK
ncbi:MAG: phosphomethylpyrimidine synthase ThiC [Candidatus Edwardsbacteria bacterium]